MCVAKTKKSTTAAAATEVSPKSPFVLTCLFWSGRAMAVNLKLEQISMRKRERESDAVAARIV